MKIKIAGKEFEIDNETITGALENEQGSIELQTDDIILRTVEEEETFKTNLLQTHQSEAYELARKNVLKGIGIEPNGAHRSDDTTLEALKNWSSSLVESKVSELKQKPDERVQALENDLNTLKTTLSTVEQERDTFKNEYTNYKKTNTIKNAMFSVIPDNVVLPKDDMYTILQTKIKTDVDENGNVFALGQDGQPVKDPRTLQYTPIKDVVNSFFENNPTYTKGASGGHGGGDSGSAGQKQSIDEFMTEMKDKNIALNSPQYVQELQERQKNGTLAI